MDINIAIENLINIHCKNLNINHKKLLILYLSKLVLQLYKYYKFNNFKEQLLLNNCRDVIGLLVLLLPYFNLDKIGEITTLDIIYFNKDKKGIEFESTYYIDHGARDIQNLLETSYQHIIETFKRTRNKLLCNWLNVFPYTLETIETNNIYKNLRDMYLQSRFKSDVDDEDNTNITFELGYDSLYGTIFNHLYEDIYKIKWLIYDINYIDGILPTIIYIADLLKIHNIINTPYQNLSIEKRDELIKVWDIVKKNLIFMRGLILFYIKWEKDESTTNSLGIGINISDNIDNIIKHIYTESDDLNNIDNLIYNPNNNKINEFINKVCEKITYDRIYEYIYTCMQQFRYTWYGFKCLDENKNILSIDQFRSKYIPLYQLPSLPTNNDFYRNAGYITPKIFYNYFKSLLHIDTTTSGYIRGNKHWNSVTPAMRKIFINRLNCINIDNWFNIGRNLGNSYVGIDMNIRGLMTIISNEIKNKDYIPRIIIETLIQGGTMTYIKYNPKVTDIAIMPNKNKNNDEWVDYITKNVNISDYLDGYHFLNNKKFKYIDDYEKNIKENRWFANFGGDWIAQIQTFHHFIHQRVLFITGATGSGKSTVVPQLFLYAFKAINYNSNAKIFCTQPRIQPTTDNALRIAKQIGTPIIKNNINNESEGDKQIVKSNDFTDINYIQYKYSGESVTDDKYHLTLRLLTDGTLLEILKERMLLKKIKRINSNETEYSNYNFVDMILVDEAHEHNPNMDMILTLVKFGIYINNEVSLGIISATMENDELIYRKYYELIDDNWKFPLNINKNIIKFGDANLLDRRIHLSPPFQTTNFTIKEKDDIPEPSNMDESILKNIVEILGINGGGDILIFQATTKEITELVKFLNSSSKIPNNVLAIPFYSKLKTPVLELVKAIDKNTIRNSIKISKNADFNTILQLEESDKVNITYERFIIIATNIAEASITINTLKYVIDTGTENIVDYDIINDKGNNKKELITESSRKQRKGRIGRVKPGTIYYKYDRSKLSNKPNYKICIQNIQANILDMIVVDTLDKISIVNKDNDPNMSSTDIIKIREDIDFLLSQYAYINYNGNNYNNPTFGTVQGQLNIDLLKFDIKNKNDKNMFNIVYPYDKCKYDCETIIDEDGTFYIISPNELQITRDENLKIIKRTDDYNNKVILYINVLKMNKFMDEHCYFTDYYHLCMNIKEYYSDIFSDIDEGDDGSMEKPVITLNQLRLFVEFINFSQSNYNYHNVLLFTICDLLNINKDNFKNLIRYNKYSEILNICYQIPYKYYNVLTFIKIGHLIDNNKNNKNYYQIIKELTSEIFKNLRHEITIDEQCSRDYERILLYYYLIKIKIDMIAKRDITVKKDRTISCSNVCNNIIRLIQSGSYKSPIKICTLYTLNEYEQFCYILIHYYENLMYFNIPQTNFYMFYKNIDITQAIEPILKCELDESYIKGNVFRSGNNETCYSYIPPSIFKVISPIHRTIVKIDKIIKFVPCDDSNYNITYYSDNKMKEGMINKKILQKFEKFKRFICH
jgi:hypothetical protein